MAVTGKVRKGYIDVAKGLAIVGVYFGHHLLLPSNMIDWFWSFHMPLFFIITGMYSNSLMQQQMSKIFSSGLRDLVLPYFVTELLLTVALLVMMHQYIVLSHPIDFIREFFRKLVVCNHPIWFLLALFYGRCLVSLIFTPPVFVNIKMLIAYLY